MRIAIAADAGTIERGTGVARYTSELVKGLSRRLDIEVIGSATLGKQEVVRHTALSAVELLKCQRNFDLFHALAPINALSFPLLRKPTVVTYHDLATLLFKKGSALHVRVTAPYFYKVGKYCSTILAISTQTKQELIYHLHFPQDKIRVVNPGVAEHFVPQKLGERTPLVIGFLGNFVARRRVDYLIMAFHYLKRRRPTLDVKLKICGQGGPEYGTLIKLVDNLNLRREVEFHGSIPEDALVDFYNSLDLLVVPSEWEGFGLPILEAQRCGIPVVTRADAHIPDEVCKHSIKATSERDMGSIFYRILTENVLRHEIAKIGLEYSRQFTWQKTLDETIWAYEELMQSS